MISPEKVNQAQEQIRQWHAAPVGHTQDLPVNISRRSSLYTSFTGNLRLLRARAPRLSQLFAPAEPLAFWSAAPAGGTSNTLTISTLALLQAVAWGEISPKAAYHLVRGTGSTLALLQAVAGGEISPRAASQLLSRQS